MTGGRYWGAAPAVVVLGEALDDPADASDRELVEARVVSWVLEDLGVVNP